ncbi:DUF2092 domain-containing protein [Luteimonas cucumeris]|nr:DUF2092 domain-containing protein [Luteimonas cucumeris]
MALSLGLPLAAQTPGTGTAPAEAAVTQAAPLAIDPAALAALDKMGAALRAMQQFTVTSDTSREIVLETGQKVQLDGEVTYKVKQPNQFFADVKSDRRQRQFFYDGKDLTIYSPRLKYYTTLDGVDSSLREMVLRASENYGIELPLTDLFLWGTEYAPNDAIRGAIHVGPGTIDGERIDQYAFRQEGVDWQVWISQASSLPRKLVITTLDDPARPQYVARLDWDSRSAVPASTFAFTPPQGAAKIEFVPVEVAVVEEN